MRRVPPILAIILLKLERFYRGNQNSSTTDAVDEAITPQRKVPTKTYSLPDAGADRLLLFAGIHPIATVPSNAEHVLVRMLWGSEHPDVNVNYQIAQEALSSQLPNNFTARKRAYLLLQRHAELTCKRDQPHCENCPVNLNCVYFSDRPNPDRIREDEC
jgi:endonuclease III-like uncharacterized protein